MKFRISRSSESYLVEPRPSPYEGAVMESPRDGWQVEIGSLEELVALLDATGGALILFAPTEWMPGYSIEIYDDHRE